MKVAVSATEGSLNATVDPRFGRAAWILIVDTESKEMVDAIDNRSSREAAHGAGISAAAMVADKGVQAVLTGRVGPKAMPVLQKAGVQVVNEVSGRVMDAIANFSGKGDTTAPQSREEFPAAEPGRGCGGQGRGRGGGQGMGQGKGQGRGQCRR